MTTRAIMLAEIQADTGRTATAQVTAMTAKINAAIRHYQPKTFWFNETRSVLFNTVIGTDTYAFNTATATGAIAAEFYGVDGIWITIASGDVRKLDQVDYAENEAYDDSQTTNGQPSEWSYINKAVRLWRPPDAIYSCRVAGHVKVAAPASDAETDNPWMTEAYDLIMCRAKAELYAHKWEDPQNAALMVQAEASALKILQDATADKTRTGFIEATDF